MKLSIPVVETIQKRHSVRTYANQPLLPRDRDALLECMKQLDNPFGVPVHTYIIDKKLSADGEKLGTYGVIKGASTFLGISIPDTKLAPLAAKRSLTEILMRSTMKSTSRKEWKELFYQADFHTPLTQELADAYAQPLEMVRLAPSAKNAQPWRVRKREMPTTFMPTTNRDSPKARKPSNRWMWALLCPISIRPFWNWA